MKAGKEDDLKEIASRFQSYIFSTLSAVSPIPSSPEELDERIAVLSALLETPGPRYLEYHLARLFKVRNQRNDLRRALHHIRRATSNSGFAPAWLLYSEILYQMDRNEEAIEVLKEGITRVPVEKSVFSLYQAAGELLAQTGKVDEAIALLTEGIARAPVGSVFPLYQAAGELLAQTGKVDEAIALLTEGIARVPAEKSVFSLYQAAGELLAQTGKVDEATALLTEGIARVPVGSVSPLYQAAGNLLAQTGKVDEAIALLNEGIARVPVEKNAVPLYQAAGILLTQAGKTDEALTLLEKGIEQVPIGRVGHESLIECALLLLVAEQDIQKLDTFLSSIGSSRIEEHALALGQVLRFMVLRNWNELARTAERQAARFAFYSPLVRYEAFGWLVTKNLPAAKSTLQRNPRSSRLNDPLDWLAAWIFLEDGNLGLAKERLSAYLGHPVAEQDLSRQFLLRLWDTAPPFGSRVDLAYYFPILPASFTGLPNDVVRVQYGPGVITHLSSYQAQAENPAMTIPSSPPPAPAESKAADWPVWMDDVVSPLGNKPRLDLGIVIALEEEFRELAPQVQMRPYYNPDIKQYYYLFERSSTNAALAPYRCVVTFMGTMGPTDAVVVADRLIAQFNPATIVSIGIAGSMDKGVLAGDVVVADQTDEYLATSKAIETIDKNDWDIQFSGNPYKSDPAYIAHAANLRYAHAEIVRGWESMSKRQLLEWVGTIVTENLVRQHLISNAPRIHIGHIASGQTVGAAKQFVQWLKERRDRKFLALEMESVGVLNAAHKRAVSSLIIRGISDYSDERKETLDELGRGALRRYGMNNALALLWVLMDLRLIHKNDHE